MYAICNIYLDTLLHAVRFCYIYFVIYVQYVWIGKCVLCNFCNWQCMCIKIRCLTNVYVCVFFLWLYKRCSQTLRLSFNKAEANKSLFQDTTFEHWAIDEVELSYCTVD